MTSLANVSFGFGVVAFILGVVIVVRGHLPERRQEQVKASSRGKPYQTVPNRSSLGELVMACAAVFGLIDGTLDRAGSMASVFSIFFSPSDNDNSAPGEFKKRTEGSNIEADDDTSKFNKLVRLGLEHQAGGRDKLAEELFRKALAIGTVTMAEAAEPMMRLARIRYEVGDVSGALILARTAADHRRELPDDINMFAEMLIGQCELGQALKWLEQLPSPNDQSERLKNSARAADVGAECVVKQLKG